MDTEALESVGTIEVRQSEIHGRGVFLVEPIKSGEKIGAMLRGDPAGTYFHSGGRFRRTEIVRFVNTSDVPTMEPRWDGEDVCGYATDDLDAGVEVTMDYDLYREVMKRGR